MGLFSSSDKGASKRLVRWAQKYKITAIPSDPDKVKQLKKLDLKFKNIEELPTEISALEELVELNPCLDFSDKDFVLIVEILFREFKL